MTDDTNICACPACTLRRFFESLMEGPPAPFVMVMETQLDQETMDQILRPVVVDEPYDPEHGFIEL